MNEKNIALANDSRLLECALYWQSKGNMIPLDPESVGNRFAEFKGLVRRGSFTMKQLEKRVFGKYGFIDDSNPGMDILQNILKDMTDNDLQDAMRISKTKEPSETNKEIKKIDEKK